MFHFFPLTPWLTLLRIYQKLLSNDENYYFVKLWNYYFVKLWNYYFVQLWYYYFVKLWKLLFCEMMKIIIFVKLWNYFFFNLWNYEIIILWNLLFWNDQIYRNVTIETDPRMGVVDISLLNSSFSSSFSPRTTARATVTGGGPSSIEGMFHISNNADVLFKRVYLTNGRYEMQTYSFLFLYFVWFVGMVIVATQQLYSTLLVHLSKQ